MTVPAILPDDKARARLTDPLASHAAADQSAATIKHVADAVLWMIAHYGPCTGRELNDHYRNSARGRGWPVVSYDSPRKRAAELADDGRLVAEVDGTRGHPAVYHLPDVFELVEPPLGEATS